MAKKLAIIVFFISISNMVFSQVITLTPYMYSFAQLETGKKQKEDFSFIDKYIAEKRIVFLGEDHHAVSEYNTLKSELIAYLHKKFGFDVVLMESRDAETFWGFSVVSDSINILNDLYKNRAIMPAWLAEENRALFFHAQDKNNPIVFGGLDLISSLSIRSDAAYNNCYSRKKIEASTWLSKKQREDLLLLDSTTRSYILMANEARTVKKVNYSYEISYQDTVRFHTFYNGLKRAELGYKSVLSSMPQPESYDDKVLSRVLKLRPAIIQTFIDPNCEDRYRDSFMAVNLQYYADTLFPGRKIIVWAHDGHIAKNGGYHPLYYPTSISYYLPSKIKKEAYVISLKMSIYDAGDTVYAKNSPNDKETIENKLASLGDYYFLDIREEVSNNLIGRKYKYAYFNSTYDYACKYDVSTMFDGIFYLKKVQKPHYSIEELKKYYEHVK